MTAPALSTGTLTPEALFKGAHSYDWEQAFYVLGGWERILGEKPEPIDKTLVRGPDDVAELLAHDISFGDYAETTCVLLGRFKSGEWFYLDASCDTTGWDCQAGGRGYLADSLDRLLRFGPTIEEKLVLERSSGRCLKHEDCAMHEELGKACLASDRIGLGEGK